MGIRMKLKGQNKWLVWHGNETTAVGGNAIYVNAGPEKRSRGEKYPPMLAIVPLDTIDIVVIGPTDRLGEHDVVTGPADEPFNEPDFDENRKQMEY